MLTHVSLQEATTLGDVTEVPLETKFVFILLGPPGELCMCAEIARSLGALFTDDVSITTSWCKLGPRVFLKGAPNFKQFECSNGL